MFANVRLELLPNMEGTAEELGKERAIMMPPTPPVQLPSKPIAVPRSDIIVPVHNSFGRDGCGEAEGHQLVNSNGGEIIHHHHHVVNVEEESSFCAEQLKTVAGFNVTLFGWPCCPKLLVGPLYRHRGLSVPSDRIISGNSIRSGCFLITSSYNNRQKVIFKQGNVELFSLTYKPRIWRAPSIMGRFANVYIPERGDRIGLVNLKQDVADGAVLIDRVNHLQFRMTRNSTDSLLRIKIINEEDSIVAIGNGSLNINPHFTDVSHKYFQISFCDEIVHASYLTKILLLSGIIMAAIEWEEELTRGLLKIGSFVIFLLLILGLIFLISAT